jgi:ketosteroid isomerase-like protein
MVQFPGAYRALMALLLPRLLPRSRLRRALLRHAQISGYAAAARRDYQLMLVRYAPDVEVQFEPDLEPLGLTGTHRGHAGMLRMIATFEEAWEDPELRPAFAIDMGDRGLGLGHFHLRGATSGVELKQEFAQLIEFPHGVVAREREFLSWDKGLEAAGLAPEDVGLA